jgi:uncharacterized protein (DUF1697 family)
MARYVAFLRAVSPMNAKMPELRRAFEAAGFTEVKTVLSSGNVVFSARAAREATLERKAEAAMVKRFGKPFYTIVRSSKALQKMLDADPFSHFRLSKKAKRVVSFVRKPHPAKLKLPIELHGARILAMQGGDIFTAYVPSRRGPVFMNLIDKTFGKTVTTRTWDTVRKCAGA